MRRREFISLVGGAAAWPLSAFAQSERMRRVGVLVSLSQDSPETQARLAAFTHALQDLGWTEGRNIHIEFRASTGDAERTRKYAAELIALEPDVVLAGNTSTVRPLQQASRTVPIVFAGVVDPVASGFVDSLSHPGGNTTGFVQFEYSMSSKWLELLKEIAPRVTRAAMLRLRDVSNAEAGEFAAIQAVAPSLGVTVTPFAMGTTDECRRARRRSCIVS